MDSLLERLAEEAREFRGTHVEEIEGTPTAVEFLRYVSLNKPVVFRNAAEGWKCMNWRSYPERIKELMGNNETKVAVTPNGLADSILDDKFVLPFECSMSIDTLFSKFQQNPKSTFDNQPVFYVQSQNNNLHEDFQPLLADASDDIDWASEALGKMPDATNFWLGDSKAITSLHKDPYENLYAVIAGRKIFTLIPPTEAFCLDEKTYETAVFDPDKSPLLDDSSTTLWTVKPFNPPLQTPWISLPPLFNIEKDESLPAKFVKNCRPLVVEVLPGDILYLPSMWFHRVEQKEETLELRDGRKIECVMAINYWYDMEFDSRYAYFNFAKGINKLAKETK